MKQKIRSCLLAVLLLCTVSGCSLVLPAPTEPGTAAPPVRDTAADTVAVTVVESVEETAAETTVEIVETFESADSAETAESADPVTDTTSESVPETVSESETVSGTVTETEAEIEAPSPPESEPTTETLGETEGEGSAPTESHTEPLESTPSDSESETECEHVAVITPGVLPTESRRGRTEGAYCSICRETLAVAVDPARYTTRHALDYLGTLPKGDALQALYDRMMTAALTFHMDPTASPLSEDGEPYALAAELSIGTLHLTTDEVQSVQRAFFEENQQLFYWLAGVFSWSYDPNTDIVDSIYLFTDLDYADGSVRRELNVKLYRAVQSLSSDRTTAFDRAKDYHDTILERMHYVLDENGSPSDAVWAHNAVGYIEGYGGVCETYTEIFTLVMNYNGIDCLNVRGTTLREGVYGPHAWNIAQMDDGSWYWFDLTYDDGDEDTYGHAYFCVNDTEVLNDGQYFLDERLHLLYTPDSPEYTYPLPARAETPYEMTDEQFWEMVFDLPHAHIMDGGAEFTVTGTVTEVTGLYVNCVDLYMTIDGVDEIDGVPEVEILCYGLVGEGMHDIKVGDRITVCGMLCNYWEEVSFHYECRLVENAA